MEKQTIEILKNAATINQGILFLKGNKIRTMSVMKNIFMEATVPDEFDREFAVYDLNEFLSTLSLFPKPDIKFKDAFIEISSGSSKVKYYYSSPTVVIYPPKDKTITIESDVSFTLKGTDLEQIIKAASIMKLSELEVSEGKLTAFNKSNVGNRYDVQIEGMQGDPGQKILNIENLKMITADYRVVVGERALKFTNVAGDLQYIVSIETE